MCSRPKSFQFRSSSSSSHTSSNIQQQQQQCNVVHEKMRSRLQCTQRIGQIRNSGDIGMSIQGSLQVDENKKRKQRRTNASEHECETNGNADSQSTVNANAMPMPLAVLIPMPMLKVIGSTIPIPMLKVTSERTVQNRTQVQSLVTDRTCAMFESDTVTDPLEEPAVQ